MIVSRPGAQALAVDPAVPPLDDELAGLFEDLRGFGPDMDALLGALYRIATRRHTTDSTQTHLAVLAGDGPNVISLLAQVIARLGDPGQNPALRRLPTETQDAVRQLTADYAALTTENSLDQLVAETCAVIDGI